MSVDLRKRVAEGTDQMLAGLVPFLQMPKTRGLLHSVQAGTFLAEGKFERAGIPMPQAGEN